MGSPSANEKAARRRLVGRFGWCGVGSGGQRRGARLLAYFRGRALVFLMAAERESFAIRLRGLRLSPLLGARSRVAQSELSGIGSVGPSFIASCRLAFRRGRRVGVAASMRLPKLVAYQSCATRYAATTAAMPPARISPAPA